MNPYLAVIADSFRAAFASRILWLALLLVAIFLLVLAPIGYHEVVVTRFSQDEMVGRDRLIDDFSKALGAANQRAVSERTSTMRIAQALPDGLQTSILAAAQGMGDPPRRGALVDAFNNLLDREDDWYEEASWAGTTRLREQRELESQDEADLSQAERRRRARLRLEGAMPGVFRPRPDKSIVFSYLFWDSPVELPVRREQLRDLLNEYVLPAILRVLLGIVGIILGILVTASVIPDMLQPGSLHLLLSKPISRSLLYLSRFVGGCAFVLLCVGPLIVGMWLIAGWRLDLWNHRLLYCIPIFMLLFAVYFSVSALAGLWWRSGIVSVAITVVFWVVCGIIGIGAGLFNDIVSEPATLTRLAVLNGEQQERIVLAGRKDSDFVRFDEAAASWQPLSDSGLGGSEQIAGPFFLTADLAVATRERSWPAGGSTGSRTLLMLEQIDQWRPHVGPDLPSGIVGIGVTDKKELLLLSNNGLFQASAEQLREGDRQKPDPLAGGLFGGLTRFFSPGSTPFMEVTPEGAGWQLPLSLAVTPAGDQAIVYSRGQLLRLTRGAEGMPWRVAASTEIEGDGSKNARLAATESEVIVFREEEPAIVCELPELTVVGEVTLPERQSVTAALAAPSGSLVAALLSDGRVARIDTKTRQLDFPSALDQGEVASIAFQDDQVLVAAIDVDELVGVDWSRGDHVFEMLPQRSTARQVQTYLIEPLRTIVPQTGKLSSETVSAIIGGTTTRAMGEGQMAEATRQQLEVTRPIVSCGLFIAVLLAIGCIYIRRQDF